MSVPKHRLSVRFNFDKASGTIAAAEKRRLGPLLAKVLNLLIESQGGMVAHRQLKNLWTNFDGTSAAIVSGNTLTKAVSEIHGVLRAVTKTTDAVFIKTLRGSGYELANEAEFQGTRRAVLYYDTDGNRLGRTPLPPRALAQSKATVPPTDISGKWYYRCTEQKPFYEFGGVAEFKEHEVTRFGIQWRLSGERQWERKTIQGERVHFQTPVRWYANLVTITQDLGAAEPEARWDYPRGTGNRYAHGFIERSGRSRKAAAISGKFYYLPPDAPIHGSMEFRRTDTNWPSRTTSRVRDM